MNSFEELNKSICRLCLRFGNSKNMVSLIDKTNENGLSCYAEAVSKLTKVVIKKHDPLPKLMCLTCLHLLKQAVYFKLQSEHTDKCFQNISHGHYENKNIKQAIAEFAMLNFYLDYKYSFSSTPKEKGNFKHVKSKIANKSHNNIDHLQYGSDSPIDALHSDLEDDHSIKDTQSEHTKVLNVPIENTANYIIVRPLTLASPQTTRSTKEKHDENLLSVLEEMFIPKEYNMPIKRITLLHKKFKNSALTSTAADNKIIKRMEEMFGTNSCEPDDSNISSMNSKLKFRRRIGHMKFRSESKLKRNLTCNVCKKVLANQHTYEHHMQRHTGCRYMCEHCGKGFPVLKELQIHQLNLHGTGPHLQCSQCSFKAARKLDLVEHERIHTGERPYTCEKCGLTFRRRGIWRKHLIYHNEKNVQCPQCNKKFHQRSDMLAHANSVHERMYVYLCNKCGSTYAKISTVRRHMTERHGIAREDQGKILRINKKTGHEESTATA